MAECKPDRQIEGLNAHMQWVIHNFQTQYQQDMENWDTQAQTEWQQIETLAETQDQELLLTLLDVFGDISADWAVQIWWVLRDIIAQERTAALQDLTERDTQTRHNLTQHYEQQVNLWQQTAHIHYHAQNANYRIQVEAYQKEAELTLEQLQQQYREAIATLEANYREMLWRVKDFGPPSWGQWDGRFGWEYYSDRFSLESSPWKDRMPYDSPFLWGYSVMVSPAQQEKLSLFERNVQQMAER